MYTLFIVACFILIGVVLLQSGKADAAAVFGGGGQSAFGPRGTTTLLQKITVGAAVAFMVIAFLFSLGVGGPKSAATGISDRPAAQTPELPKPAGKPATAPASAPEQKPEQKKEDAQKAGSSTTSGPITVTIPTPDQNKDKNAPANKDQGRKNEQKKQ